MQTAESEVLHDESEAYARQLEEAGVHVTAVRYNGMIHNWDLLSQLSGTRSVMFQAAELKAALK